MTVKSQLIIDNGEFLTDNEKSELTTRLQNLKDKSTVETMIYTTMDLGGKSPIDYGMDLSRKYPAGIKGINNGIIILLSKNDRKLQILVGYGLEWILSDNQTQIIVDQMIPFFKKGEFYNGVNKAIDLINKKVIDIDWKPNNFKEITDKENGKIFKIQYSKKTGDTKYKYAIDTDQQFSDDFKIKFTLHDIDYDLYYTKYMNDMISKILTSDKITVYFRLSDFDNKRLELIGIE
ncbi:hypothetical protein GCM10022260_04170 [Gaetbulibacter aestuarii]